MKRFIRETECQEITGLGRTSRWRLEKEGKFPKRYKISKKAVGWLLSELEEWMQSMISTSASSLTHRMHEGNSKEDKNEKKS